MPRAIDYATLREMIAEGAEDYPDSRLDRYLSRVEYVEGAEVAYDHHRAASLIWMDKAATVAARSFDVQVDATRANRSELVRNYIRMARFHARLSNAQTVRMVPGAASAVTEDV